MCQEEDAVTHAQEHALPQLSAFQPCLLAHPVAETGWTNLHLPPPRRWHITLQIGCHPALHPLSKLPIDWPAVSICRGVASGRGRQHHNSATHRSKENITSAPLSCNCRKVPYLYVEEKEREEVSLYLSLMRQREWLTLLLVSVTKMLAVVTSPGSDSPSGTSASVPDSCL